MSHPLLFILSSIGSGVVQMVRYFKTSQSIRVIAPLNGHFKSGSGRYRCSVTRYLRDLS